MISILKFLRKLFSTSPPAAPPAKSKQPKTSPGSERTLAEVIDRLKPLAKPCVRITAKDLQLPFAKDPLPLTASKFGGRPYLPRGESYPVDKRGRAMVLLAQINLSEVTGLPELPEAGLLQIFVNPIFEDIDYEPTVIYRTEQQITAPAADSVRFPPVIFDYFYFETVHELSFAPAIDPGNLEDETFGQGVQKLLSGWLSDKGYERIADDLYDHFSNGGHQIGGYAEFTQSDPRKPNTPAGYQLLQMDSKDGIMIGDAGLIHVFLDPTTIKPGRIPGGWFYWDCC